MPALVPQTISRTGLVGAAPGFTTVAGDGSDSFPNSGRTIFALDTAVGAVNIDINVQAGQCSDNDLLVAVAIGESAFVGPFPVATYGTNPSVGGMTGEQIAALELAV